MPNLSQEEINKMYEKDPQSENNSEKGGSKDNFIDRKEKGSLVRKMRKIAIILWALLTILLLAIFLFGAIYVDIVMENFTLPFTKLSNVDLTKSPYLYLSAFFFIALITDKKDKLDSYSYWFKNQWGWLNFFLILSLLPIIILPIFVFIVSTLAH
ncbi:hypothetical protein KJ840_00890 [Patescibacteria group bacterium]|nr:hypothetical protein [Patescibacteria group bacterium]